MAEREVHREYLPDGTHRVTYEKTSLITGRKSYKTYHFTGSSPDCSSDGSRDGGGEWSIWDLVPHSLVIPLIPTALFFGFVALLALLESWLYDTSFEKQFLEMWKAMF